MNANSQQDLRPNRTMLENTFPIFNNGEFATCFTANYNGQEYLITAKHLFKNIAKSGDSSSFKVVAYNKEIAITSNVFFHSINEIDIAVVKLSTRISQADPIYISDKTESYGMGQDCYFLGFPLGFSTKLPQGLVPLIKRATTSGLRDMKGKNILLLDGHNNVGFSGGPVITTNSGLKEQFVIGIISGYFPDPQVIEVPDDKGGTKKITYNSNSGIILCFQTDLAVEIIKNIK